MVSSSIPAARFPAVPLENRKAISESFSESETSQTGVVSDDALVARIRTDDAEALGLLFDRYARLVWTIARRILRNNEEAEDLLQDLFLLVRRKASAFQPSKGSVRSLLVQMCYQRAFSRRRDLARRNFYSDRSVTETGAIAARSPFFPPYDEGLEARIGRSTLQEAFEDLSIEQRETIRLCFFEGYTLEEIAGELGLSYGNVRHHYYRGLAKLRKRVARE